MAGRGVLGPLPAETRLELSDNSPIRPVDDGIEVAAARIKAYRAANQAREARLGGLRM